jgi:hypothetical protein
MWVRLVKDAIPSIPPRHHRNTAERPQKHRQNMSKTWTRKRVRQKKKSSRDHNIAQVQLVGSSKWCNKQIRISIPSQESQIGRVWCSCGSQNWGGNKATKLDISSSKLTQLIIAIFIAIYFWVIFNLSTHAVPFSRRCCHFRKSVHGGPPERYMHTTPVIDQRQAKHMRRT